MGERLLIAAVTDLLKTGLSVEQQILVNEIISIAAGLQAVFDADRERKEANRERMRAKRARTNGAVQNCAAHPPHPPRDITKKNITPPKPPLAEPLFDSFWEVYPLKVGKGAARKAFRHACLRASAAEITEGAKRYAASRPDPKFTKHPSTWLNADCWLDEGAKVITFRNPAPRTWKEQQAEREKQ